MVEGVGGITNVHLPKVHRLGALIDSGENSPWIVDATFDLAIWLQAQMRVHSRAPRNLFFERYQLCSPSRTHLQDFLAFDTWVITELEIFGQQVHEAASRGRPTNRILVVLIISRRLPHHSI